MLTKFFNKIGAKENKNSVAGKVKSASGPGAGKSIRAWRPGDIIADKYKVEEIMSGSMGNVYISEHLTWNMKMALKAPKAEILSDKEGMKCILKEANSWILMGMHPNIASCYYVQNIDGAPYIFIEYVDGGNLADWIKAGRCRDLRTALSLAIQFCHGMEYTHANRIIHRDIKPQNILITKNALVKITDFGIVMTDKEETLTDEGIEEIDEGAGGFRGTPGYASPEQFLNSDKVDKRTDIYSFGLCLWLMLCGRKPYPNNHEQFPTPEPKPSVQDISYPQSLNDLLKKCVEHDPDNRFQDFTSLRKALNSAYIDLFKIACPYAELQNLDLRSDSMNNRAVSLIELGKIKEAARCLNMTLDLNDALPEAVYNLLLLKWRKTNTKPERLLRQIEVAQQRFPGIQWFADLEQLIKNRILKKEPSQDADVVQPQYRLCVAKKTLEIFREGQILSSVQRNMLDHLENKRYQSSHDVLLKSWRNNNFKKDPTFARAYEELIKYGKKTNVEGCQRLRTLKGYGVPVRCLTYIPKTRLAATSGPNGNVLLRDIGPKKTDDFVIETPANLTALTASPKGDLLGIGMDNGEIILWSVIHKKNTTMLNTGAPVTSLAFSHNGRTLASGNAAGALTIHKLSAKREEKINIKEGGAVKSVRFVQNTLDFITGSEDGNIRFFDAGEKGHGKIMEAHALPISSISLSADGRKLVSGSADRYVKVWERRTALCKKEIKAHEEAITSVLMFPDNKFLISGCEDDILKIWNSENGKCSMILDGRGDGIYSLAQGPKPHIFLSGRRDGAVVIWMLIYSLDFN